MLVVTASRSRPDPISDSSMEHLLKAQALVLTLTLTLGLTQTDIIKRLFMRSPNPGCLPATILRFCQARIKLRPTGKARRGEKTQLLTNNKINHMFHSSQQNYVKK